MAPDDHLRMVNFPRISLAGADTPATGRAPASGPVEAGLCAGVHSQAATNAGQPHQVDAQDLSLHLVVPEGLQPPGATPKATQDQSIRPAVMRRDHLVEQLLAVSRHLTLYPAPVQVFALMYHLAGILVGILDQRIRVTVRVAPDCPPCMVDAGQLESALVNLVVNARDAMLDGGTLGFRAWPVDRLGPEMGASSPSEGHEEYVAMSVSDTGDGMSDAVKARAIEPFFTTKEAGCGKGLGLSAVAGFIEQSCGAMRVDSRAGVGTTVTLFLPKGGHPGAIRRLQPLLNGTHPTRDLQQRVQRHDSSSRCPVPSGTRPFD